MMWAAASSSASRCAPVAASRAIRCRAAGTSRKRAGRLLVCAPNTLIADDGGWAGHVDLGALGVADCWADPAIATWSTTWNYEPGWEEPLLEAYGIGPDPVRTRYYRLLWDLGR